MREEIINGKKVHIQHFLADGTEINSLSEYTLPAGHPMYKMLDEAVMRVRQNKEREKEGKAGKVV